MPSLRNTEVTSIVKIIYGLQWFTFEHSGSLSSSCRHPFFASSPQMWTAQPFKLHFTSRHEPIPSKALGVKKVPSSAASNWKEAGKDSGVEKEGYAAFQTARTTSPFWVPVRKNQEAYRKVHLGLFVRVHRCGVFIQQNYYS